MTPRTDIDWIDLKATGADIRDALIATRHSRLPAGDGINELTGVVQARELLAGMLTGRPFDVRSCIRPAPIVHDKADALDVLGILRSADVPMALVYDEHGCLEGIVTPADILEAVAGVFRADIQEHEPALIRRDDGSWLLAGDLPADEMADTLGIDLPEKRDYQTTAGFILSKARRLPKSGEAFTTRGWRFEVVDMDGQRIDKVLATRLAPMRRKRPT
jgi:putative hemolysin